MKRKSLNTAINLTDAEKIKLMNEIHAFFDYEYEEDIGIVKQQKILDLFMEQMAPTIYNKALDDAILWYKQQQDNIETDYYSLYKDNR